LTDLISTLTENILRNDLYRIDRETALRLAAIPDSALPDLVSGASRIRRKFVGDAVFTCTILNAKSGRCSENCAFCAQSGHFETRVATYPLLSREAMVTQALEMADAGITNFSMVTSGFRLTEAELDTICETAAEIRRRTGLRLCCSIGVVDRPGATKLVQAGITHYHHNLETARSFFDTICTTHQYDEDIASIRTAAEAGLTVCAGGIFGLGEKWGQRIELALTLREIGVRRVPLNFIHPIAGTPLAHRPLLSPMEALKCIALFRYLLPDADITICGGREVTLRDYRSWIFLAGANGIMTGNYLTTLGRDIRADLAMIADWQSCCQNSPRD